MRRGGSSGYPAGTGEHAGPTPARAGYLEEARLAFEKMLTHASHGGLYAGQISAAFNLNGGLACESPGLGDDRSPARRRGSAVKARAVLRVRPAILEDPGPR